MSKIIQQRIGIDVGGVIIDKANDGTDTSFIDGDFAKTTAVPGTFGAIAAIVTRFGAENVFIISKCGTAIQQKTLIWLGDKERGFYTQTGFLPQNIRFCKKRNQKAGIAQRLGITCFIDDREDVLGYMDGIVPLRCLFGPQKEPVTLTGLTLTATWSDVLDALP